MALPEEFRQLAKRVSNWGRWGDDDERGTLNLITPEAIRRGTSCVRRGAAFTLAIPLDETGPQIGQIPGRVNPRRTMTAVNVPYTGDPSGFCASDDSLTMGLQSCTHWDALAHVSYDGLLYNGYPASAVTAEAGATRCGIDKVGSIVTRGVLLDAAGVKGVERLEPGYPITTADLDAAEERAGTQVEAGDVVLVRTGHIRLLKAGDRDRYAGASPGLAVQAVEWFHARDIAAVAVDNLTFEVFPCEDRAVFLPVHLLHLRDMGLTQGQNWDLEDLAADCAADGVYEFLLEASPEPFTGGLGGPVNPVAVK